jgi:hypothetical protein
VAPAAAPAARKCCRVRASLLWSLVGSSVIVARGLTA